MEKLPEVKRGGVTLPNGTYIPVEVLEEIAKKTKKGLKEIKKQLEDNPEIMALIAATIAGYLTREAKIKREK